MKHLFLLGFILVTSLSVFGQSKTVSNTDLERFKQKRLAAEREYRENYEKLGFPSPEELKRRNEQSFQEMEKLSDKLRVERLARENAEAIREQNENFNSQAYFNQPGNALYPPNRTNYYFGFPQTFGGFNYGFPRTRNNRFPNSAYIERLRETDFINRRNGYTSPFRPAVKPRPNFTIRGGRRN